MKTYRCLGTAMIAHISSGGSGTQLVNFDLLLDKFQITDLQEYIKQSYVESNINPQLKEVKQLFYQALTIIEW